MKIKKSVSWITLGMCMLTTSITHAITQDQSKTLAKLNLVSVGFSRFGYAYSKEYLSNWRNRTGSSRNFPPSALSSDMLIFLKNQKVNIISQVQQNLYKKTFLQGRCYRVKASNIGMPRPGNMSDFKYAIGGCTVNSYADVNIGYANYLGQIKCTISYWGSTLSDVYKFDYGDKFDIAGFPLFVPGELYGLEAANLAKKFSVSSNQFYYAVLKESFSVSKPAW